MKITEMPRALKQFLDVNKFRFSLTYNPVLNGCYVCTICSEHGKVIFIEPWVIGAQGLTSTSHVSLENAFAQTMKKLETTKHLHVAGEKDIVVVMYDDLGYLELPQGDNQGV